MTPPVPSLRFERKLESPSGLVIGCDEVGRGAIAGPLAVGMCVVDLTKRRRMPEGLRDSKLLSEARREQLEPVTLRWSVAHAIGFASAQEIDRYGLMAALGMAAHRALDELRMLGVAVDEVPIVLDGNYDYLGRAVPHRLTVHTKIKADQTCASVAGASVLSKVARDRMMIEHDAVHPGYGWSRNKGYGSEEHREAISRLGTTDLHRLTWLRAEEERASVVALPGFDDDGRQDDAMRVGEPLVSAVLDVD
ncbi:ribonuclease [Cnuibacter physcomitrellae]|uniref:Ribonuclease n=1 Tax=Cnuibacter physcomitrellae TaxID=1619308 RepID=A0A1X9LI05_9MICO|nr:ribonuclease HII [Cnuibacter physcomitrellae]ARJ04836.1 ribonuclease HII [Cnuibacter physcomitrellae]GGI41774.1 ribonuclease [Cnuibacter physcomitrellae]